MKSIAVISASLSESSSTDQLGRKIADEVITAFGGPELAEASTVSLRVLAHDIIDAMLTGYAKPSLEDAFETIEGADAIIAVTPAYNASMSGLFKSFFDVLPQGTMEAKPVIIGATGGTPRHSLVTEHAMRPMFTYLRARVVSTAIFVATEDWGAHAQDSDGAGGVAVGPRTKRAASELVTLGAMGMGHDLAPENRHSGSPGADATVISEPSAVDPRAGQRSGKAKTRRSDLANASATELVSMDPHELYTDFTSFEDLLER